MMDAVEARTMYYTVQSSGADGLQYYECVGAAAYAVSLSITQSDPELALGVLHEALQQAQKKPRYDDIQTWRNNVAYVLYMMTRGY